MKEFQLFLEEQKLTLTIPQAGDGSMEIDGVDYSWGFNEIKIIHKINRPI